MENKDDGVLFTGIEVIQTKSLFEEVSNTFTIEFWAQPSARQDMEKKESTSGTGAINGQRFVIGPGNAMEKTAAGVGVSVGTNGVIVCEHSVNYLPPILVYKRNISEWTHVAIVYRNKTPSLYINGKLVKNGLTSKKVNIYPSGSIGGHNPYGHYEGLLKDVRIWNFAKTDKEISEQMNEFLAGNEKGLIAYWSLTKDKEITSNQTNAIGTKEILDNTTKVVASTEQTLEDELIFCTSICANYLPKAKVLAKSIKKFHPNSKVIICLVESDIHPTAEKFSYFDKVILAKDLEIENFNKFIMKYNALEASTAVKGALFSYLLRTYKHNNKFIYLDPDIYVMDTFNELNSILEKHSIVVTPHTLEPEDKNHITAIRGNEIQLLQKGTFNLGFLAISRSPNSERFISWWSDRLSQYCYDDTPNGLFTDQKWVNLAPCFFDVFILKHPGYNVAPWNLSKRSIHRSENELLVNNKRLKFVHFSGFDSGANLKVTKLYVPDQSNPIYTIYNQYVNELIEMGQGKMKNIRWSYERNKNDKKVKKAPQIKYQIKKK
ncbi:LamG-like jellyroll fold domain-containing protein [Alkalihalobacterium elongatum]|uniref:LamG-like jellyroll fold domain-containing protein n=1 Tax=Alkalihalobacterium elongatum TaxID=2675466 RepID=UPI001C1F6EFB|nr:LamG-like jellyroll fold domain-containing protein [Alkalihalobacterium elongatum]